ncbi:LysR family transcriptional regulator [Rhizobium sp. AG855]|uniref:LysR family transcriptional regulator n=1 Tax=Rhizobium sp. AG855 TaxID=2183898 RepID=UPI000FF5519C|nr:LysR family transcriptional regulator [Rhizobium sp. AG855]RKE79402.1 DNA-binding transcriptional LysR family regulator [Rhizobium sp. AG855]
MDTFTLIAAHTVLTCGGLRQAARTLARPAASVSAALIRLEKALATPLMIKTKATIAPTLEAQRLRPDLETAADISQQLHSLLGSAGQGNPPVRTLSLLALQRYCDVVRAGSIRRAARDLQTGQPQLSRQIAGLETLAGQPLLERTVGGTLPTAIGRELLAHAEALDAVWQGMTRQADRDFRRTISTFRLGTIIPLGHESETARQLAALAARWLSERPKTPLFISSTTAEDLLSGLQSGQFDLALLDTDLVPAHLERKVVANLSLAIVGRPPLLSDGAPDLPSLICSRPIAVPSKRSGLRQMFTAYLASHLTEAERDGLTLLEIDSLPILVNLVLEHGFLAVLPEASFAKMDGPLDAVRLEPDYDLKLTLAWPPSFAARRLADLVLKSLWVQPTTLE